MLKKIPGALICPVSFYTDLEIEACLCLINPALAATLGMATYTESRSASFPQGPTSQEQREFFPARVLQEQHQLSLPMGSRR